jgi:hypothetical protein
MKAKPVTDDELEGVLSEIIRKSTSAIARIRAVTELRNLRARRERERRLQTGAGDPFSDLDELEPRRAKRAGDRRRPRRPAT